MDTQDLLQFFYSQCTTTHHPCPLFPPSSLLSLAVTEVVLIIHQQQLLFFHLQTRSQHGEIPAQEESPQKQAEVSSFGKSLLPATTGRLISGGGRESAKKATRSKAAAAGATEFAPPLSPQPPAQPSPLQSFFCAKQK